MIRPDWDSYFMAIAKLVSTRSTCNSRPTGAVLVKDRQILATGYNGSMPGVVHCSDAGKNFCFRRSMDIPDNVKYDYCRSSHAEANAIAQAAKHGIAVAGATLYVTLEPCYVCIKLLATAQVKKVFFETFYNSKNKERDLHWRFRAAESGIECEQLIIKPGVMNSILWTMAQRTSARLMESI